MLTTAYARLSGRRGSLDYGFPDTGERRSQKQAMLLHGTSRTFEGMEPRPTGSTSGAGCRREGFEVALPWGERRWTAPRRTVRSGNSPEAQVLERQPLDAKWRRRAQPHRRWPSSIAAPGCCISPLPIRVPTARHLCVGSDPALTGPVEQRAAAGGRRAEGKADRERSDRGGGGGAGGVRMQISFPGRLRRASATKQSSLRCRSGLRRFTRNDRYDPFAPPPLPEHAIDELRKIAAVEAMECEAGEDLRGLHVAVAIADEKARSAVDAVDAASDQ